MELRLLVRRISRAHELAPQLAMVLGWACLGLSLVHAVSALSAGWDLPLLDRHSFRQTQTALTARSLVQGGPWFAYETPVFGAPWSIPFEFPLYQLLVAGVRAAFGTPLDQTGRLVSCMFYLATLLPFYALLRALQVPPVSSRLALACFLTSPLYLYWSRAFLIESTALFFSVSGCALGLVELQQSQLRRGRVVLAGACAMVAAVMKLTTAFGWLCMLGIFWLAAFRRPEARRREGMVAMAGFALALFVAPLLLASAWTHFCDAVKSENLLADVLISSALRPWLYGTWQQKSSLMNWAMLLKRTLDGTFGHTWLLGACAVMGLMGRLPLAVIAPLLAMLVTYGTFFNLHIVHDYYQYATGLFLIVCTGVGLGALERVAGRHAWLVPVVAAFALLQSKTAYETGYKLIQTQAYWMEGLEMARFVGARTPPKASVLIYGLDWSPELPYYAERRAIMNRGNLPLDDPRMRETLVRTAQSGYPVSTVVTCRADRLRGGEIAHAVFGDRARGCENVAECVVCTPSP